VAVAEATRLRPLPPLGARYFVGFVVFQLAVLVAAVLLADTVPLLVLWVAAVPCGLVYLAYIPVYPWLVVPLVFATTALDITGRLIEKTAIGIPLTGFHLSLGLMFVALALNACLRRRLKFPPFSLQGPLLSFLAVVGLSLTYSVNHPEATIDFVRLIFLTLFLYGAEVIIDSRAAIVMVLVSLVACMISASILAMVQILTEEFFLPASFVTAVGANTPRATGTFHNPNHLGTFLMSGLVILTTLYAHYPLRGLLRWLVLLSIAIGLGGLASTFSRANWMALIIGAGLGLHMAGKLRWRYLIGLVIALALAVLALKEFVPFAEHIFERFSSIFTLFTEFGSVGQVSSSARVYFVMAGFGMFFDNPLLGAGWRSYPVLLNDYKPEDFPHWIPTQESHTTFATIFAEVGLVGVMIAVWFLWRLLSEGFRARRELRDPFLRAMLSALLAVFVAFQVSICFTADFNNNFLWFFSGMIYAVIRLGREEPAP
jgi:putative inorganic carbon (hco3(-)) transporter